MYAVVKNAPDDVLENMIETATVENLEHQNSVGSTILHDLVLYAARVSTLRRVLQRTNTKINTQNIDGQTPLHYCLRDWETTRSYEYHKEAAIVLITYGASASIKDEDGKTPLDFYDENRCRGYEETTRSEKKKELRDLIEELSIPSEILARGPDAVKAFKDALKNGEITIVNSRLMFLGKEGSGKTSCVKAMLGKEFNKDEPSTDGIVTTTVFQTVGEDHSKWEEQENVDVCEQTKQILEYGIATDVAKKLKQQNSEQNKSESVSHIQIPSSSSSVASTSAEVQLQDAVILPTIRNRSRGYGRPADGMGDRPMSSYQHQPSSSNQLFLPQQLLQLRAQILAYKYLAANQPLPDSARSAVQGKHPLMLSLQKQSPGYGGPTDQQQPSPSRQMFLPQQLQQLKAQIQAYKYLAQNQPLPDSLRLADQGKQPLMQSLQQPSPEKPVSQDPGVSASQLKTLRRKVIDSLANKSSGPRDITCIWDYAGQMIYYITHRVFLTDGSSYGVVFSLLDDLEEFAKPRDIHKGHFEMTNLQMIIFWIRSIYEHTVLQHRTDKKPLINGTIASPPISLIGTHKDRLEGSDAEKQALIEAKFKRIFKEIEDTPFESHVDRNMYAVANNAKTDEGIERLKVNVGGYMKAMAKTVPINWVDFQTKVQEAGKTTMCMSLNKITKMAADCGVNEENVIHVLNYLNDVGIILYSPTNEKLKNTVITNIHMLIGIFMKIITVVKPDDVDKVSVMVKYWRKLDNEGILSEPLVRYLWKNELTASKDDSDFFEDCIELMKTFGLLFEKNESEEEGRLYVVPSRMKTQPNNRLEIKKDDEQTVSIYVTPKDFLPDAVYDVLVVRFVSLSQDRGFRDDPKLFQNKAKIVFDHKHYVRLGRIFIDNKQSLKLEITRMKERDAHCVDKPTCKPHPSVCTEVLNMLKKHLDEVYPSKKVVGYSLNILCFVCMKPEKPHFQDLEDCLKNECMHCDKTGEHIVMPTVEVQNLFVADLPVDNKRKKSDSDQIVAKKLKTRDKTDEERGCAEELSDFSVLKAVVSSWYDRHRSLSMLKVLFRDKVDNHELAQVNKTMTLLNNLITHDHLSSRNLGLLYDTISITKHLGLLKEIKEKLPSFPDVNEENISTEFTLHRQKLMKFGMVLTTSDVTQIDELCNTPTKDYTDSWEMITDLEDRLIVNEGNMTKFTDLLKLLNLTQAMNALTT